MSQKIEKAVQLQNRKARFEYEFIDTLVAGMVLTGTEIKSIRQSNVQFNDAYCSIENGEIWLMHLHIAPYAQGTHYNHNPTRPRKLLLTKKELRKLEKQSDEKGLTIIPFKLFINDRGIAKVEIALARGKKLHDKRESIKERDVKKQLERFK